MDARAACAWLLVRNSTKPNPMLRDPPGILGSSFVLTRADKHPSRGSKTSVKRALVVEKFRFRIKRVEVSNCLSTSSALKASVVEKFGKMTFGLCVIVVIVPSNKSFGAFFKNN